MPVRKKDGKWYWGGQGPFNSKKKAEEVAQAAYASGYTKKGWLTNPRGSTDSNKHEDAAEEERQQGFRYRKGMGGWGRGGQQEGTKPTIPRSKNRKLKKDMASGYGSGLNAQGDSLKRGAYWDQRTNNKKTGNKKEEHEESAVQKFLKYDQGRSINHPSYPPTHSGLLGPKRIDWKKKHKTPIDNTQPTEFVEKNVQKQVDLFEMPDFWISKFIDIARQRGLAVILKEAEDEEEKSPQEDYELIDVNEEVIDKPAGKGDASGGVVQWDTETMGPMPKDKVPIHNPSEAPEGTRLIEGPRGGFYYTGDPEQLNNPEYHEAGQKFDMISEKLKTFHEENIAPLIAKEEKARSIVMDAQNKLANAFSSEELLEIYNNEERYDEVIKDFPEIPEAEAAYDDAQNARYEAGFKQEKLMNQGVEQLLKLFSSKPIVEGVEIDMSPTVKLNHDEFEVDGETHYIRNSFKFQQHVQIEAREDFDNSPEGKQFKETFKKNNPDANPDEVYSTKQYQAFEKAIEKAQIDDLNLGGFYLPSQHNITLNPHLVAALYGSDDTKFFDAMHTITHEMVHTASHGEGKRDKVEMVETMADNIGTVKHVKANGIVSPFKSVTNKMNHVTAKHFATFMEEAPTEAIAHVILTNRYGRNVKASSREEAANIDHLTSSTGYNHVMPTFARWALAKHNDSPKAARKAIVNLLHEKDTDKVFNDFLHYMAVGTHANSDEMVAAQAKASGNQEVEASLSAGAWNKYQGNINLDGFEQGQLKQYHAETSKAPTSIDPEDYIKYNKETFKTVPDDTDFKWLLYGERD